MAFSCEDRDAATLEFLHRTSVEVREPVSRVTIPLFNVAQRRPHATGVLLRVRDKYFILTAAHVFDKWPTRPIPIDVTDGVCGSLPFPIGAVTLRRSPTRHPEGRLEDDPYDACVCDITAATAERIVAGGKFRFLDLSEVDPWTPEDTRSWYFVFGFPGELNQWVPGRHSLSSNACAIASFIYCGERGVIPWDERDRGVGILVDYSPTTTQDDQGRSVCPPDPGGMSGGGMWRIAEHGTDSAEWSLRSMKLIGIQSAVYETMHVLRGTRIEHALGFIYRAHEDLRPEFDREFGTEECRRYLR